MKINEIIIGMQVNVKYKNTDRFKYDFTGTVIKIYPVKTTKYDPINRNTKKHTTFENIDVVRVQEDINNKIWDCDPNQLTKKI